MQNKQGLGPGARLTIAVSLCILVSFPFFLFYLKALPRLQALVQGKEMREKENIVTMTRYVNMQCKNKFNIVYLKTHKVRNHSSDETHLHFNQSKMILKLYPREKN